MDSPEHFTFKVREKISNRKSKSQKNHTVKLNREKKSDSKIKSRKKVRQ